MSRRLIAIDLDGTLLGEDSELSTRSADAVRAVSAAGHEVVVATGRPPHLISIFGDELAGSVGYVIATNGSLISRFPEADGSSELLQLLSFDLEAAHRVVRGLRERDPRFGFALATDAGFAAESGFAERMPADVADAPRDVMALGGSVAFKLFAFHPDLTPHEMVDELPSVVNALVDGRGPDGERFAVSHMGAGAVEIGPGSIDKAAGLRWLAAHLGFDRRDVIAIGDEWNDLGMLRWAGVGVAVGNAHDDVLAIADLVIAPNTGDGVARFLEQLIAPS
jgi:hydroxymethylpyrimidine pyrophosphatase-like HAD family hydrolase